MAIYIPETSLLQQHTAQQLLCHDGVDVRGSESTEEIPIHGTRTLDHRL
jgi:hypothetical protein